MQQTGGIFQAGPGSSFLIQGGQFTQNVHAQSEHKCYEADGVCSFAISVVALKFRPIFLLQTVSSTYRRMFLLRRMQLSKRAMLLNVTLTLARQS